jgi:hypothetical protein
VSLKQQPADNNIDTVKLGSIALKDIIKAQPLVLLWLISNITGIALKEDMAITNRHQAVAATHKILPTTIVACSLI